MLSETAKAGETVLQQQQQKQVAYRKRKLVQTAGVFAMCLLLLYFFLLLFECRCCRRRSFSREHFNGFRFAYKHVADTQNCSSENSQLSRSS